MLAKQRVDASWGSLQGIAARPEAHALWLARARLRKDTAPEDAMRDAVRVMQLRPSDPAVRRRPPPPSSP